MEIEWIDRRPRVPDAEVRLIVIRDAVPLADRIAPIHSPAAKVIPMPATFEELLPDSRAALAELEETLTERREEALQGNLAGLEGILEALAVLGNDGDEGREELARAVADRLLLQRRQRMR